MRRARRPTSHLKRRRLPGEHPGRSRGEQGGPINYSDAECGELVPSLDEQPDDIELLVVQTLCGIASTLVRQCPRQDWNLRPLLGQGGLSEGDRDRILSGRARKRRDHQKVAAFYYGATGT